MSAGAFAHWRRAWLRLKLSSFQLWLPRARAGCLLSSELNSMGRRQRWPKAQNPFTVSLFENPQKKPKAKTESPCLFSDLQVMPDGQVVLDRPPGCHCCDDMLSEELVIKSKRTTSAIPHADSDSPAFAFPTWKAHAIHAEPCASGPINNKRRQRCFVKFRILPHLHWNSASSPRHGSRALLPALLLH